MMRRSGARDSYGAGERENRPVASGLGLSRKLHWDAGFGMENKRRARCLESQASQAPAFDKRVNCNQLQHLDRNRWIRHDIVMAW
jgi:hypothetical protein